ncbi:MAG TPA: TonB family protein [Pyrinomonadaceae bacterium]|jgi:TonB family protein
MLTRTRVPLLLLLCLTATCLAAHAQTPSALRLLLLRAAAPDATETDRARDGLSGPVRRVRTETAKLLVRNGQVAEGPRVLLETATYDMKGAKIDNAYYLATGGALTGKEVYKYDDRGNIVEMTLYNADGSVLSKEVYQYEFDAMGNWTKMMTSVAVVENGKLNFEPTEVTYRSISYFLDENVAKAMQAPTAPTAAAANAGSQPQPVAVVKTNAPAPGQASASGQASAQRQGTHAAALPKVAPAAAGNVTLSAPTNVAGTGATGAGAVVKVEDGPPPPAANTRGVPVKPVSGGVLNGRAIAMPAPDYPETARRVRASGLVAVEVVIDVTGRVISAKATSGHASLRVAAEGAAMKARFSPTLLSGQPVKVTGVINYNFNL